MYDIECLTKLEAYWLRLRGNVDLSLLGASARIRATTKVLLVDVSILDSPSIQGLDEQEDDVVEIGSDKQRTALVGKTDK